jgi:hypothetical protein
MKGISMVYFVVAILIVLIIFLALFGEIIWNWLAPNIDIFNSVLSFNF